MESTDEPFGLIHLATCRFPIAGAPNVPGQAHIQLLFKVQLNSRSRNLHVRIPLSVDSPILNIIRCKIKMN